MSGKSGKISGRAFRFCAVALCCLCLAGFPLVASGSDSGAEQLVSVRGKLPRTGRVVIRSGLAWLPEDASLFLFVERAVAGELRERGLTVVSAAPSVVAPFPAGTEAVRGVPVPKHKGAPRRVMSVAEAVARMKAMDLAREGRLPQARFGKATGGKRAAASLPGLSHQELIRFALSQEDEKPELRGQVTVPGRLPDEITASDPALADYALTARFAMLWPGSGIPDETPAPNVNSGLAVGWHLLELACYDLAPVRQGKPPLRIWNAAVQRVAYGAYLRGSLPGMARGALEASP